MTTTTITGTTGLQVKAALNTAFQLHDLKLDSAFSVKSATTNTPPASPADGDLYIVGPSPTGLWAGKAKYLAKWMASTSAWSFLAPSQGMVVEYVIDDTTRSHWVYDGSAWDAFYEEGTFTPTLIGTTTAGSHTYTTQTGFYTRVGDLVTVDVNITLSAKGGTMAGNAEIGELPFTSRNDSNRIPIGPVQMAYSASALPLLSGLVPPSSTRFRVYKNETNAAVAQLATADITATTTIRFSATYQR